MFEKMSEITIQDQIKFLIQQNGAEILRDGRRLNNILADLFPKAKRERATIRTALDAGAGRMFYEYSQTDPSERPRKLQNIRDTLKEEAWMSEQACDYVVRIFLDALGMPETKPNSAVTPGTEKRPAEAGNREMSGSARQETAAEKQQEKRAASGKKSGFRKVIAALIVVLGIIGALVQAGVLDIGGSESKKEEALGEGNLINSAAESDLNEGAAIGSPLR